MAVIADVSHKIIHLQYLQTPTSTFIKTALLNLRIREGKNG
jgi:hypothetical protein